MHCLTQYDLYGCKYSDRSGHQLHASGHIRRIYVKVFIPGTAKLLQRQRTCINGEMQVLN